MSPEQRRYVLLQSGVGAAIVNALLNGGIGWLITRGFVEFPVWRLPGVVPDIIATTFGVTFGTVLAMVVQVRWDVGRGKVLPFTPEGSLAALVSRFPTGILPRSIVLGLVSVPLFATPVVAGLALSHLPALDRWTFVGLKALVSAVEGGLVTPVIVVAALEDVATSRSLGAPPAGSSDSAAL